MEVLWFLENIGGALGLYILVVVLTNFFKKVVASGSFVIALVTAILMTALIKSALLGAISSGSAILFILGNTIGLLGLTFVVALPCYLINKKLHLKIENILPGFLAAVLLIFSGIIYWYGQLNQAVLVSIVAVVGFLLVSALGSRFGVRKNRKKPSK